MRIQLKRSAAAIVATLLLSISAFGSAYNARPKMVVLVVVDQLRGDLLERYHDQFVENGFRLLMDRGAYFSNCKYQYANTRTAPGHATLGTGTYTLGHGILANEYWDPAQKKTVDMIDDPNVRIIGADKVGSRGASPLSLQSTTLGDELRLATGGKARVFGVALKRRAAILPVGFSANAAYWIDYDSGLWVTSTWYMQQAPEWLLEFNRGRRAEKYQNLEWKDADGAVIGNTRPKVKNGKPVNYYDNVGATPFGNQYTVEFVRELIEREQIGEGPATDFLSVSFSATDILGHDVGPDSREQRAMILALDRQLADFFAYLGRRFGLANVVIALSADHGIAPVPEVAAALRIPAKNVKASGPRVQLNNALSKSLGRTAEYVPYFTNPLAYLNPEAFGAVNMKEAEAERAVGEALKQIGMRSYITKSQLASGDMPPTVFRTKYLNSYTPLWGWWVIGEPAPFMPSYDPGGTDHSVAYSYDTYVPLAFYGVAFRPGNYRHSVEPVDLAVTLGSLLGINPPTSAVGRVLSEAFVMTPQTSATEATR